MFLKTKIINPYLLEFLFLPFFHSLSLSPCFSPLSLSLSLSLFLPLSLSQNQIESEKDLKSVTKNDEKSNDTN